jgi:hypothetical protein
MNVGMIFECGPEGADVKVCTYLARRLRPDIVISPVTLTNKPTLVAKCGEAAATLLNGGCERVVIVWDLYPAWRERGGRPCRKEDRDNILQSLANAGVNATKVSLVCIQEELEAWLLADHRALELLLSRPTRPAAVSETRQPERVRNPKAKMQQIFRKHGRVYNDLLDAEKVARELPDLQRLFRRSETFQRFALKVADLNSLE